MLLRNHGKAHRGQQQQQLARTSATHLDLARLALRTAILGIGVLSIASFAHFLHHRCCWWILGADESEFTILFPIINLRISGGSNERGRKVSRVRLRPAEWRAARENHSCLFVLVSRTTVLVFEHALQLGRLLVGEHRVTSTTSYRRGLCPDVTTRELDLLRLPSDCRWGQWSWTMPWARVRYVPLSPVALAFCVEY